MGDYMKEILKFINVFGKANKPGELKQYLEMLGINFPPEKVIIVAGTNGKGTTCVTLQKLLIASGKNVGLFTSPHIKKINERIKYNGVDISDENFEKVFEKVHNVLKDFRLSGFEYLTMIAAYYFYYSCKIDYLILEVGLGGTLDSTNAFDHKINVITKLGLDHENILGKGIENIAENKLGIIHDGGIVFHFPFPTEAIPLAQKIQKEKHAKFFQIDEPDFFIDESEREPKYFIKINEKNYKLNLLGRRAVEDTNVAVAVFKYLEPDCEKYLQVLNDVYWPCRMEKVKYLGKDIFLSGDHNPQGISSLIEILEHFRFDSIYFVIGTCYDKNHEKMLEMLSKVKHSHICLTETPEKTLAIDQYTKSELERAEFIDADPVSALQFACEKSKKEDLVVVTGSLYLTGFIASTIE